MWPHRKKSTGVRFREVATDLKYIVSHSPIMLEPHFSWMPMGFPPAFLVAFPPETPSQSVHLTARVTSKAQSKCHAQCCPNIDCKVLLMAVNRYSMWVCFCLNMVVVTWKPPPGRSKPHPWTTTLQESWASLYSGVQSNAQIGLVQDNRLVLVPIFSASGRDGGAAPVRHSTRWSTPTVSPIALVLAEGLFSKHCRYTSFP